MTVINTNVKSLITQTALARNSRDLSDAMHQLATGKRINAAADDAAGLAITNKMTAQIRGLDQAVRNSMDAISMMQTAEGATIEITNMLQRMRELAVQAANGTNSSVNTGALQKEFDELQDEIRRISSNTEWNGMKILGASAGGYNMQIGANVSQTLTVSFSDIASLGDVSAAILSTLDITASTALTKMDSAISAIDNFRTDLGSKINRLEYTVDNLTNISNNTSASRSRILDADYAKASSEMARTQIIQQAATSVLAQANVDQQSVLKLLQGG
jgi:flagellin